MAMAEAFAYAMNMRDQKLYDSERADISYEREKYFRKQRDHEKEKFVIKTIQKYTHGMDLASYIQEFEDIMRREDINKRKWSDIFKQVDWASVARLGEP